MNTKDSSTRLDLPVAARSPIEPAQQTAAKVAGSVYLLMSAIVVSAFSGIYSRLVVAGNAAETARNIMAHERLFRVVIACDLIYGVGAVVLLTALYAILAPVNRGLALLAAFSRLGFALIWVVSSLNLSAVLRLLSGADYLGVWNAGQLQAMVRLHLSARFDAYYVALLFWGVASAVSSYLWFKSKYIPRGLAVWGLLSSVWAAACAVVIVIDPSFGNTVSLASFDVPIGTFEIATSFWLLFRGLPTRLVR